jgi:hypothetical protein
MISADCSQESSLEADYVFLFENRRHARQFDENGT